MPRLSEIYPPIWRQKQNLSISIIMKRISSPSPLIMRPMTSVQKECWDLGKHTNTTRQTARLLKRQRNFLQTISMKASVSMSMKTGIFKTVLSCAIVLIPLLAKAQKSIPIEEYRRSSLYSLAVVRPEYPYGEI